MLRRVFYSRTSENPHRRLRRIHLPRTRVNKGNSPHLRVGGVSSDLPAGCPKEAFGFVNYR
jgi:hypothetical protein